MDTQKETYSMSIKPNISSKENHNYNPQISRRLMEGICGVSTNTLVKYAAEGIIQPKKIRHGGIEIVTYQIPDIAAVLKKKGFNFKRKSEAEVIAVFSQKGGVGKSATASQIASLLSLFAKVLVVDLDSQGDVSNLLGAVSNYSDVVREITELDPTISELMDWSLEGGGYADYRKLKYDQVIKKIGPNLDVIPAGLDLGEINFSLNRLPLSKDRFFDDGTRKSPPEVFMVKDAIEPLKKMYDFVIFDCGPNIETLNVSALLSSNRILMPIELEAKTLMVAHRNEEFLKRLLSFNSAFPEGRGFNFDKILLVPNKFSNTNIKMKAYAALQDIYEGRSDITLSSVLLPTSSVIDKCQEAREPIFLTATRYGKANSANVKPAKEFTDYFWAIIHELMDFPLDRLIFGDEREHEV